MDFSLKDLKLWEVIKQLETCRDSPEGSPDSKVRILYSDGSKSCVGKILAVGAKDDLTIYLFPVPEDIERVNALSKLMTSLSCDKAAKGQECGSCPSLAVCPQMEAVSESIRRVCEGPLKAAEAHDKTEKMRDALLAIRANVEDREAAGLADLRDPLLRRIVDEALGEEP